LRKSGFKSKHKSGKSEDIIEDEEIKEEVEEEKNDYEPIIYDESELDYFKRKPTLITNYLYLGYTSSTKNKTSLRMDEGITHIVNCSARDKVYNDDAFYYLHLEIKPNDIVDITEHFGSVFDFIRKAVKKNGKVLIVEEENGEGAALIIAYLMENVRMKFFQAFQHVVKRRYVATLKQSYNDQLMNWGEQLQKSDKKQSFSCYCKDKKFEWFLLQPFDKTERRNPLPCNCQIEDSNSSDCPSTGCSIIIEKMEELRNWGQQYIYWGYTTRNNIEGNFGDCEVFVPSIPQDKVHLIEEKEWTLYRCKECEYVTHAISKSDDNILALVTNKIVNNTQED